YDSTVVVPPGFTGVVDDAGNLSIACPSATETEEKLATPILMRVIGGALNSAAREMASVLFRMPYSSIIRESEDLEAVLCDRHANALAASDATTMYLGSMPEVVRGVIPELSDDDHEDHVIVHNDPYLCAPPPPVAAITQPAVHVRELVGFSGAAA